MNELSAPREKTTLAQLLDALPSAVYMTDAQGVITYYNRAAALLAGREPVIGKDLWCVSHRLYSPDGEFIPHERCPMAVALREQRAVRGVELVVERPDGVRVPIMPFPTPLTDANGAFIGAVNVLIDISEQKRTHDSLVRRTQLQAAMLRLTDGLYRASSIEECYDAALDAIAEALECKRASILLFDDAGVARFVATRGISDAYRAAVEGHCPWHPGQRNPEPIFVEDIDDADEPDGLKATIKAEGIRRLAFVPLVASGGTMGKFMTYHAEPGPFGKEERDLALTIAQQLGFALERWQAERHRQVADEIRARLASIVESSEDAVVSKDLTGRIVSWNQGAERLFGYTAEEAIGQFVTMLIPEAHVDEETEILSRIRRGERVQHYETVRRRKDGTLIDLSLTISPVRNARGEIIGASKIARDIGERRRADEHKTLLIHELNHRVKNTLATVQALAMQSFRDGTQISVARDRFEGRLGALARAHDVLTNENWQGAWVKDVVVQSLAPFALNDERLQIGGPRVRLSPRQLLALSMALHELATNAAKYGSLSVDKGSIEVLWRVLSVGGPAELQLTWTEKNGPPVVEPTRKGFGSRLISQSLANELSGTVRLEFRPAGVVCRITAPIGPSGMGVSAVQLPDERDLR